MTHPFRTATFASLLTLLASGVLAQGGPSVCVVGTDGALEEGCTQPSAGTAYGGAVGANGVVPASAAGDLGFAIRIGPAAAPTSSRNVSAQDVGRLLDRMGVQVRYDGLGAVPKLNVATSDLRDEVAPGDVVAFRAATNYPAWVASAQVVVRNAATGAVVATLPVAPNGTVSWTAPASASRLSYAVEVRDAQGRTDSTVPRPLEVRADPAPAVAGSESLDAVLAQDRAARRAIPVRGGMVTVLGSDLPEGASLTVMGETVRAAPYRAFAIERILPPGTHGVTVEGRAPEGRDSVTETVDIPESDWFATAMVDVTLGRGFQTGRLAGYATGVLANGTKVTARIDTEEGDLDTLFRDLLEKDPRRTLRAIDATEPFLTYGDDSVRTDLAPSSGRLFGRVERGGSYAQWGDFETAPLLRGLARDARTLYGASAVWEGLARTEAGEARLRATAFAAAADTAVQRDSFKATGASAFFLSRRDITKGSETIVVETRDAVSGQVLERRTLTEGVDYRLNTLQGVITLAEPVDAFGGRSTESFLVASYEYAPTTPADGGLAGGRLEAWASESVRLGVEARVDTSTSPTTRVVGADLRYQPTPGSFLDVAVAESRGPGAGETLSQTGGLTLDPVAPVGGAFPARGMRVEGRLDLADVGLGEGKAEVFASREEAGFVGPDGVVTADRERGRLAVETQVRPDMRLTFGARFDREQGGLREADAWLGAAWEHAEGRTIEAEVRRVDRSDAGGTATNLGARTDVALRYTVEASKDLSWWVYGQSTLDRSGGMRRDDRVGAGVDVRVAEGTTVRADASHGTLGWGAEVGLRQAREGGSVGVSYVLDPHRRFDEVGFSGKDRGVFVLTGDRALSPTLRATAETRADAFGDRPSATSRYGLAWTPREGVAYELGVVAGSATTEAGADVRKSGVTAGVRRTQESGVSYALRGEWIRDRSDDPLDASGNLDTYALKGSWENRMSEDWRMVGSVEGLWSDSPVTGVGTGRYAEASLGFAYRPVASDRTIALASYTFLEDRPASGQRNIDGDTDGDGQRSHILNLAVSHKLAPEWTLGAKYGLRHRELFPAAGGASAASWTQMGVVRVDYHLNHQWDASAEVRGLWHEGGAREHGALAVVSRKVGDNTRLGLGYAWGGVSDDLRTVAPAKEGLFVNLTMSF